MGDSGKRLRAKRQKKKLTMDELAERVGFTSESKRTIIYQIESGKSDIPFTRSISYASALDTNVYYLLGMTDIDDMTDEEILELVRAAYAKRNASADSDV